MKLNLFVATAVAITSVSMAMPASAAIVIYTAPGAVNPSDDVLFSNLGPAASIAAPTNHGGSVTFTGTETLASFSGGQARISGNDGTITYLSFAMTNPALGISEVEFLIDELNGPNAPANNKATVTFYDQFNVGTTLSNFALGPGNDWFAASTTGGSVISRVEITTLANVDSIKQVRVTGAPLPGAVPEPATWAMMIAGFGAIGLAARRRRRIAVSFA